MKKIDPVADAIRSTLISPNVTDGNLEPANVVDALDGVQRSLRRVADAIAPVAAPGKDTAGGHVECLTEACMGMTAGLCRIADSLADIAEAIREHGNNGCEDALSSIADAIKESGGREPV